MALVLNTYWGARYCRWAAADRCTLTEAAAVAAAQELRVRYAARDSNPEPTD